MDIAVQGLKLMDILLPSIVHSRCTTPPKVKINTSSSCLPLTPHHTTTSTTLPDEERTIDMFSSPARPIKGTPRRGVSRAPRTPSVLAERDREAIPPPSTARTNRLAQIRRDASPTTSVRETVRTAREVEGYDKVSWSRDDRRVVGSLGSLPKEVNGIIKSLGQSSSSTLSVRDTDTCRWQFRAHTRCGRYLIRLRHGFDINRI